MNITIYVEDDKANTQPAVLAVYPDGIAAELATLFPDDQVKTVSCFEPDCGLSAEVLENTDVLFWWGHRFHGKVPDEVADRVVSAVQAGMGFIALHSAHMSKPFRRLMGTSCTLRWRDDEYERVWISSPGHPIAEGLPPYFELDCEEMYGEYFDVPTPDDLVAIGWFRGGEVFKSILTYRRGYGKAAYFQPGHETCRAFYNLNYRRMLQNAAKWAAPTARRTFPVKCVDCPPPPESDAK